MGRYVKDIELNQPIDVVSMVMDDYVYHERFGRTDWNGEMVYGMKDRHGRNRYMKWHYAGGVFHVEAWLRGAFGGEMDLDGIGGGASRREYRRSMEQLLNTLRLHHGGQLSGGHVGSDPLHHSEDHRKDHTQWRKDTNWQKPAGAPRKTAGIHLPTQRQTASASQTQQALGGGTTQLLAYAVISLVLSASVPFFGIVLDIVGLGRVRKSSAQMPREMEGLLKVLFGIAIFIVIIRGIVGIMIIFADLIYF